MLLGTTVPEETEGLEGTELEYVDFQSDRAKDVVAEAIATLISTMIVPGCASM